MFNQNMGRMLPMGSVKANVASRATVIHQRWSATVDTSIKQ